MFIKYDYKQKEFIYNMFNEVNDIKCGIHIVIEVIVIVSLFNIDKLERDFQISKQHLISQREH